MYYVVYGAAFSLGLGPVRYTATDSYHMLALSNMWRCMLQEHFRATTTYCYHMLHDAWHSILRIWLMLPKQR